MTTPREKTSFALLFAGIVLTFAAVVIATSGSRAGKDIYYEAKGAERFDGGLGYAVPKSAVYWFAGAALLALGGAYVIRER
jgi:hypothetical protein